MGTLIMNSLVFLIERGPTSVELLRRKLSKCLEDMMDSSYKGWKDTLVEHIKLFPCTILYCTILVSNVTNESTPRNGLLR